ncbi:MAG: hypothetical protein RI885_2084 [Actinomycetota bacterium]|jgi:AcrR family transcriptional regulator
MRSDAARNRRRILAAARELVAEQGADVAMDDIARAAGTAVGTLYRHFPTRAALVAAAVDVGAGELAALAEAALARTVAQRPETDRSDAERCETGGTVDPTAELMRLLTTIADRHVADRALKQAASDLGGSTEHSSEIERAGVAIAILLGRAQESGGIRSDVSVEDLAVLLAGAPGTDVPASRRARWIEVILDGIRAR